MASKTKKKKKKVVRWIILGVIAVAVIAIIIINSLSAKDAPEIVAAETVYRGEVVYTIGASGTVTSEESKTYFAVTGVTIDSINVEAGDAVCAGDQLISYDEDEILLSMSENALSLESDNAAYLAKLQDNNERNAEYAQAVADVDSYEALIEAQEDYIQGLKDGIADEKEERLEAIAYEMESLSIQNIEYNRQLAKLTQHLEDDEIDYYRKLIAANNMRITQLETEQTLLNNFEASENKDELLRIAEADLTDLNANLTAAKADRDSSEAALLNSNELTSLDAGNELLLLQAAEKQEKLESAMNGVVADFDGIVTSVSVIEGATTPEGTALIVVESTEKVMVEFGASKYDLEDLQVGQSAVITISGHEYEGTVSKIDRMATTNDSGAAVVNCQVAIINPDDGIFLGVDGKITITVATATDALVVPVEAVNTDRTGDFCYVIKDGVAKKQYVTTGISSNIEIEILEGLEEGDEVITTISSTLEDGSSVFVMDPIMLGETEETSEIEATTEPAESDDEAATQEPESEEEGNASNEDAALPTSTDEETEE